MAAGANPVALKRGIDQAAQFLVKALAAQNHPWGRGHSVRVVRGTLFLSIVEFLHLSNFVIL
ncbi:MAG: hypothetical protein AAGF01_20835, partial [Cyanobacteria bacterium P01_G01_bin.38]